MKINAMFRGLLTLGLAAGLTVPVLPAKPAQETTTAEKQAMKDKLQESVNELNLNDDQKDKLKDVFSNSRTKRESIMNDSALTDDQKKEKMKSLRQDTMSKVNHILTPDQQAQLKEKLAAAKAEHSPNY
jgi:periplasmic protein CpxP/Spy